MQHPIKSRLCPGFYGFRALRFRAVVFWVVKVLTMRKVYHLQLGSKAKAEKTFIAVPAIAWHDLTHDGRAAAVAVSSSFEAVATSRLEVGVWRLRCVYRVFDFRAGLRFGDFGLRVQVAPALTNPCAKNRRHDWPTQSRKAESIPADSGRSGHRVLCAVGCCFEFLRALLLAGPTPSTWSSKAFWKTADKQQALNLTVACQAS